MKKQYLILAILISPSAFAVDLQAAADDVCSCLEAPYAIVEKAVAEITSAKAQGDYSKLAEAQGEMMGVMSASNECFGKLPNKYPEIDQSDELKSQVMQIANSKCPNPADALRP